MGKGVPWRVFNLGAWLLFAAAVVLLGRSYLVADVVQWAGDDGRWYELWSTRGRFGLWAVGAQPAEDRRPRWLTEALVSEGVDYGLYPGMFKSRTGGRQRDWFVAGVESYAISDVRSWGEDRRRGQVDPPVATGPLWGASASHLALAALAGLPAMIGLTVRRLRRRTRRRRARLGRCPACAYCLTGNTSGVCPECGTAAPKGARP